MSDYVDKLGTKYFLRTTHIRAYAWGTKMTGSSYSCSLQAVTISYGVALCQ
jgi:hypothetical protein